MISYEPLFHTLLRKKRKLSDLAEAGISSRIIAKFRKNEHVNTSTLEKICLYLQCNIEDVIEIIPDDCNKNPKIYHLPIDTPMKPDPEDY